MLKARILLVDDRPENLLALEAVLECPEYDLISVNSGMEALKLAFTETFAVILLDVQMPEIDGFETARLIKSREKSKHTPIIFITAMNQAAEHVRQGYSVGAVEYIFKPFIPETLKAKVEAFVNIHRYQHQISTQNELLLNRAVEVDKEIARLDRLNMIGEMAAGIAHEIRNPLTAIRGFLQLSRTLRSAEYTDIMVEELDRANSIITEFLTMSKMEPDGRKQQMQLNYIIESLYPLIHASAMLSNKSVHLEMGSIPPLHLNEREIRQLILNLCLNGLEAMSSHGVLTVKTYATNQNAVLEVVDQGCGIKHDLIDKLGTAFFTTKERGTGLGLSVCYGVAARHQASIDVTSSERGTSFAVRFASDSPNRS